MSGASGAGGGGQSGSAGSAGACNPVTQTGCGDGYKCSGITGNGPEYITTACVPIGGTVPQGVDCTRTMLGYDDCDVGLVCADRGVFDASPANDHHQCARFCQDDGGCGSSARCAAFTIEGFGICIDACVPFSPCTPVDGSAGGSSGVTCEQSSVGVAGDPFFTCRPVGPVVAGDECFSIGDSSSWGWCGAGLVCIDWSGSCCFDCIPLCDDAHACVAPATCMPITATSSAQTLPAGVGVCL